LIERGEEKRKKDEGNASIFFFWLDKCNWQCTALFVLQREDTQLKLKQIGKKLVAALCIRIKEIITCNKRKNSKIPFSDDNPGNF
jgi:hypothetical protein